MIHYSKDCIVTVALGEAGDEVHGHSFKGFSIWRSVNFVDGDLGMVSANFILLAFVASVDIICYPHGHAGLPEVSSYLVDGLVSPWMACS
jgi:hypothetical protein